MSVIGQRQQQLGFSVICGWSTIIRCLLTFHFGAGIYHIFLYKVCCVISTSMKKILKNGIKLKQDRSFTATFWTNRRFFIPYNDRPWNHSTSGDPRKNGY